ALLPYVLWLAKHEAELARFYAQIAPGGARSVGAGTLEGLGAVLRALLYYAAPLGLLLLVLFPEIYRPRPRDSAGAHPGGRLVERTLLAGLALLVLGALLNALGQLKFRWAIPIFFLLPLYACWRLDRLEIGDAGGRRLRAYAGALLLAEALMVAGILL